MGLGFGGEVAAFYARYRRGYPPEVIDALVGAMGLTGDDTVLDLGCGTGQLTIPLAERVRAVIGMDPEPDMLAEARSAADAAGREAVAGRVTWVLGADSDVPRLRTLLGAGSVAAVTIGQALHWMDHETLFAELGTLLRPGGRVAVIANGRPLWQQDTPESARLRGVLEEWFGTTLTASCGTDEAERERYADALEAAGFEVGETVVEYDDTLDRDQLVGAVYSATPLDDLPGTDRRPEFADRVGRAIPPGGRFREHVRVATLIGRVR